MLVNEGYWHSAIVSYSSRLEIPNLTTLAERRTWGDLIETLNIFSVLLVE